MAHSINSVDDEDFVEKFIEMIEEDTGKEIFTMRILRDTEEGFEVIVVFEDTSVMVGEISISDLGEKRAMRMRGNYI